VAAVAIGAAAAVIVMARGATSSPSDAHRHYSGQVIVSGDVYRYLTYAPAGLRPETAAPLVVVLHGCSTTAAQMEAASGYDAVAQRGSFLVLYPDVDTADAGHGRCWKGIWDPSAEGRGRGDAAAITAMTRAVAARWAINRGRVYALGISAGGFQASVLGALYPDVFTAIGIHSGAPYLAGQPGCLAGTATAADTGRLARAALAAMGTHSRIMPVFVIHGEADGTVPYRCGQQAIAQWLRTDNLILHSQGRPLVSAVPTSVRRAVVPGGHAYTVASYAEGSGCLAAQLWSVKGMGHFWSGGTRDPALARYSDAKGPSASAASWAFFSRWRLSGPVQPCARR
jgi:poly(hydroxyalkanoate) depolymerase family esterase